MIISYDSSINYMYDTHRRKYNKFRTLPVLLLFTYIISLLLQQQQHVKYSHPIIGFLLPIIQVVDGFTVNGRRRTSTTSSYQQQNSILRNYKPYNTNSIINLQTLIRRRRRRNEQQQQQRHQFLLPVLQLNQQQQEQEQINVQQQDDTYMIDSLSINGNSNTLLLPTTTTTNTLQNQQQQQRVNGYNQNNNNNIPNNKNIKSKIKMIVIMNENARGVSKSTIKVVQSIFGIDNVYITKSINDLYSTLYSIISNNNNIQQQSNDNNTPTSTSLSSSIKDNMVIIPIGGDGTLATTIQTLCQILYTIQQQEQQQLINSNSNYTNNDNITTTTTIDTDTGYTSMISQLPIIAYVPLGTGNAVGSVVGCQYSKTIQQQQQLIVSNSNQTLIPNNKKSFRTRLVSIPKQLYNKVQNIYHRSNIESKSIRQLRSILINIYETIIHNQYDDSNINENKVVVTSSLPIIELPMVEISTINHHQNNTSILQQQQQGIQPSITDLCFFAGVGFDSLMLNDFKEIKEWSQRTGLFTNILSSVTGYCITLLIKTLPKTITKSSHLVQVQVQTNQLHNTFWIDHRRGDYIQPCTDTILYNGTSGIIAGSTVPYYGGKLRLFPFARISMDKLHLRIGNIHPLTGFFNIPKIFAGTYRDFSYERFGVLDFIGNDFTISVSSSSKTVLHNNSTIVTTTTSGFPLQHSGESIGPVSSFRLRVMDTPVRFLNLLPDR